MGSRLLLTSALDGGDWPASTTRLLYSQSRSGRFSEEKNPFLLPGFQPWSLQSLVTTVIENRVLFQTL